MFTARGYACFTVLHERVFLVILVHFAHFNSYDCTIFRIVVVAQRVEVSSLHPSFNLMMKQLQSSFMLNNQTSLILDSFNIE